MTRREKERELLNAAAVFLKNSGANNYLYNYRYRIITRTKMPPPYKKRDNNNPPLFNYCSFDNYPYDRSTHSFYMVSA